MRPLTIIFGFVTGEENERYRRGMREQLNFDVSIRIFDERVHWEDEYFNSFRQVYFEGIWYNEKRLRQS